MKKIITLFAVAALGAALIGCGSSEPAATETAGATAGTTGTAATTAGTTGTTADAKPAATTGE